MTTWSDRMTPRPIVLPRLELVATLFRVQGASKRPLRGAVYRVETGLELRLEYEDVEDLQRSQLFRGQAEDPIAALADEWHRALRAKWFEELAIV